MDPEMPWLERSPNIPAEASCMLIVHITRWIDVWVPCRDPTESHRPSLHLKKGPNMPLTPRKPRGVHRFNVDDAWKFFNIVRNPNITVANRKRDLNSHLTSRSVCVVLPRRDYILSCPSYLDSGPDFTEQTPFSKGYPRLNSRIYPRFLPQLEKTYETFPSLRDEAQFPCIVSRAIAFSKSNTEGASICLIELQRVPNSTFTRRDEHWCHSSNAKLLVVPKIKLRWVQFPLYWLHNHPRSKSYRTSGLTPFRNLEWFPETTVSSIEDQQFQ